MQHAPELERFHGDGQVGRVAKSVEIHQWLGVRVAGVNVDGAARDWLGQHEQVIPAVAGEGHLEGRVIFAEQGRAKEPLLFGVAGFEGGSAVRRGQISGG